MYPKIVLLLQSIEYWQFNVQISIQRFVIKQQKWNIKIK